jgi:hypothetical protein
MFFNKSLCAKQEGLACINAIIELGFENKSFKNRRTLFYKNNNWKQSQL